MILTVATALPKGIRAAVADFARQSDITTVLDHLEELINLEVNRPQEDDVAVPNDEIDITQWETGVENLS